MGDQRPSRVEPQLLLFVLRMISGAGMSGGPHRGVPTSLTPTARAWCRTWQRAFADVTDLRILRQDYPRCFGRVLPLVTNTQKVVGQGDSGAGTAMARPRAREAAAVRRWTVASALGL